MFFPLDFLTPGKRVASVRTTEQLFDSPGIQRARAERPPMEVEQTENAFLAHTLLSEPLLELRCWQCSAHPGFFTFVFKNDESGDTPNVELARRHLLVLGIEFQVNGTPRECTGMLFERWGERKTRRTPRCPAIDHDRDRTIDHDSIKGTSGDIVDELFRRQSRLAFSTLDFG